MLEQRPDFGPIFTISLPVERIETSDVTNALLFLVSDGARYVTGVSLPVDAGSAIR
ncbi:SDR family oxidoreductase [Rhodococcus sp. (in: high G+C Gram-positive bacteria)]|uniref:SDR family oxidoreductase n=1 Tax=Rhodococcus sp. TaxID=1831 RepID=UPI002580C1B1|nr:SDR family oxidoreductase [Rhodococcus sp. (in: high G+C Gram-positive bacteria)]